MASVTTSLALGAKQAVRGAKVSGKRTAAPKAVNTTAKAQISKGARPPSFGRRFDAAKTSISSLPALPRRPPSRPLRARDDADPDPHPSRIAVNKAAGVAAATTLAVTPAARASELGEVRSITFFATWHGGTALRPSRDQSIREWMDQPDETFFVWGKKALPPRPRYLRLTLSPSDLLFPHTANTTNTTITGALLHLRLHRQGGGQG